MDIKRSILTATLVAVANLGAQAQSNSTPDSGVTPDAGTLAEIVVTAQKHSENLQDVPIAVTAVSAAQLEASGITDTMDLGSITPGLVTSRNSGLFEPRLRGIGTGANGPGVENPVALVVDGVYYASQYFGSANLIDLDQISVLKGPQGTLFGRNATGGVIQITTKDPTQDFVGNISTSLDNYLTSRSSTYVSGGLNEKTAGDFSFQYATQGLGWGKNLVTGEDIHRISRDINARSKWLYTPTDDTSIRVIFDFSDTYGTAGINVRPVPGTLPFLGSFPQTTNPWDTASPAGGLYGLKSGGVSVSTDTNLGFADLVSISAFREAAGSRFFWDSNTAAPGESVSALDDRELQGSEELQLISRKTSIFNWVAGLYYFWSDEGGGAPLILGLVGPLAPTPTSLSQIYINSISIVNSTAAYLQGTAQVLPETNLTLGFRYTYEHRAYDGTESGVLADGTSIGEFPLPPFPPNISFSKPTWRLALDHQLSRDVMVYISDNRGFKSGGYNSFDPGTAPYDPETLDAYEAGIKSEWLNHTLRVNAAAFYYNYKNIQVVKYGTTETIYNGAAAKIDGLDLDSELQLGHLNLRGGVEWLPKSSFASFPAAVFSSSLPGGGSVDGVGNAAGNRLPYAPRATADLAADYLVVLPRGQLDVNITDSYNSGYFAEPDNHLRQSAFDLLNSSIRWISPNERVTVSLWAKNLLDKAVSTLLYSSAPFGFNADYGNPPRTYGFTATYRFGGGGK